MPFHLRGARASSLANACAEREVASGSPIDLEVGAKTTPRACRTAQRAREKSARSGARASRAGAATRARGSTIPAARAAVARMHILRARKVIHTVHPPPPRWPSKARNEPYPWGGVANLTLHELEKVELRR